MMYVQCSLCNAEFPNDEIVEIRKQRHEEFSHPESKTNRNVIPKYGRTIQWKIVEQFCYSLFSQTLYMANIGEVTELVNNEKLTLEVGSDTYILMQDITVNIDRPIDRQTTSGGGVVYFYGAGDNFIQFTLPNFLI